MAKVLTYDEYEEILKKKDSEIVKSEEMPKIQDVRETWHPDETVDVEYCLMYPDNVDRDYHNGTYTLSDRTILDIIGGVVRTKSVDAKNELVKKGFVFMYEKRKENVNEQ